jgi:hypothetical protein
MNVVLGNNLINDCDAALVVNGVEVFRLETSSDGKLVCDFEVRDKEGNLLAKIAKSRVVYAAEGYEMHDLAKECYVKAPDGRIIARVRESGPDVITITGDFWLEGHHVEISDQALVSGGIIISGNVFSW